MTELSCYKCGEPLPEARGTGRPRRFCSTACRRSAELEIKRANRRLESLEMQLADFTHSVHQRFMPCPGCDTKEQHVGHLAAQIRETESRLKKLLVE